MKLWYKIKRKLGLKIDLFEHLAYGKLSPAGEEIRSIIDKEIMSNLIKENGQGKE